MKYRLVIGKTQAALCVKIVIPRIELAAAVNSVRLARRVKESLKALIKKGRYLTDSSAVLGMLKTDAGKFHEFVGVRMRSKSQE
jgi:hypothetical protein